MRTWKNTLETAQAALEALGGDDVENVCGFCKWMAWPESACTNGNSDRCADFVLNNDKACKFFEPTKTCVTCGNYLGDGHCNVNLELECRDGGFEAWEPSK